MPDSTDEGLTLTVDSVSLSARVSAPVGRARATVLALPGGGYGAWYWDHPLHPQASLLRLGSLLGFRVIAVDRPGYGASSALGGDRLTVPAQAQLLNELAAQSHAAGEAGAGVFLVGHSLGAIMALEMAAGEPSYPLIGVAVSGVPIRYPDYMVAGLEQQPIGGTHLPGHDAETIARMFYGPDGTYDPRILVFDVDHQAPVPVPEFLNAKTYPLVFPVVAPRIRVPVQYVIAENEASSVGGTVMLSEAARRFSASRRVDAWEQSSAGHCVSLHLVARAYHLRVLGVRRGVPGYPRVSPVPTIDADAGRPRRLDAGRPRRLFAEPRSRGAEVLRCKQ